MHVHLDHAQGVRRATCGRVIAAARAGLLALRTGNSAQFKRCLLSQHVSGEALTAWLLEAVNCNNAQVVQLLLELPPDRKVDPSAEDNEALRDAAHNGRTEVVRLLLGLPPDRGVDPSAEDNEALLGAAFGGHTEVVRLLLELPSDRGVDPGAEDNQALVCAASRGHAGVAGV